MLRWQPVVLRRTADLGTENRSRKPELGTSRAPKGSLPVFLLLPTTLLFQNAPRPSKEQPNSETRRAKQEPGEDISASSHIWPTKAHDHFIIQHELSATSKAPTVSTVPNSVQIGLGLGSSLFLVPRMRMSCNCEPL